MSFVSSKQRTVKIEFMSCNNLLAFPLDMMVAELVSPSSPTVSLCPSLSAPPSLLLSFPLTIRQKEGLLLQPEKPLSVCRSVCVWIYVCFFWWETLLAPKIKALR